MTNKSMSRAAEDVLLIVKHVKYKKVEGSMYVMSTRAAWMNQTGDTFRVSAPYESVRIQRISPDTKDKVQLQLLLLDGASYTFHFTNPAGKDHQLEDRNSVKEMLQQLLPKFKDKVNSELEAKNKILQKRPELFQLYKDLVVSNIVAPEEFWANQEKSDAATAEKLGDSSSSGTVGVSGHFLSDIKPQVDGANGMKYHLSSDTVLSIFKTYPAVEECHQRYVPHRISESDFWIKFFQSHYFHRDRLHIAKDDLFSDCAQHDEQQLKEASMARLTDPLLDLTRIADNDLGNGYGLEEAPDDEEEKVDNGGSRLATARTSSVTTTHLANLQLIRRFNHHSLMVLKVNEKGKEKEKEKKEEKGKRKPNDTKEEEKEEEEVEVKRRRLIEQTKLEELQKETETSGSTLHVADQIERYLQGPTLQQRSRLYVSQDDAYRAAITVRSQLGQWSELQLDKSINHYAAVKALGALSTSAVASGASSLNPSVVGAVSGSVGGSVGPGMSGSLGEGGGMGGGGDNTDSVANLLTPDQNKELTQLHSAVAELLRHFWLCFPVTTPELETKVERMLTCLRKFEEQKLRPYRDRVMSTIPNSVKEVDVTGHLEDMLETAYRRYKTWRSKKRR